MNTTKSNNSEKSSVCNSEMPSSRKMSRLRSDTYIKPGSESSFDSDDGNSRRYAQPTLDSYCCISNVSIKKAVIISGIVSSGQIVTNFVFLLRGCGITMADIALAIFPIVTGTTAVLFLTFALLHNSAASLKPYIAHHLITLLISMSFLGFYILVLFHQQTVTDFVKWLALYSSAFKTILNTEVYYKLLLGTFLIIQVCTNIFCLHISFGLYLILDNVVRYVSSEGTEII